MIDDVIYATKKDEMVWRLFRALKKGSEFAPIRVFSLPEAGIATSARLTGKTLIERATQKALHAREGYSNPVWKPIWIVAEATGLCVPSLVGAPGVGMGSWAGAKATPRENALHCLEELKGQKNRHAYFETVMVAISPTQQGKKVSGVREARLSGKFVQPTSIASVTSYADIFVPRGECQSLAKLSDAWKAENSHRGRALAELAAYLKQQILPT